METPLQTFIASGGGAADVEVDPIDGMVSTGVMGQPWRASISPAGDLYPWDDSPPLAWFVAADDRWHVPSDEPTVRQTRIEGTPVTETRVRVPNGDVVQRVYSVANSAGLTVIEVENESTMPVAIAFNRGDLLTERPVADVPIEGIDLPQGSFVMPLGHAATLRVGVLHSGATDGPLPAGLPTVDQVVRGWLALIERTGRVVLPEPSIGESLTALRCELALGSIAHAADDAAAFVLGLAELIKFGEPADHWIPELVDAVRQLGPRHDWDADVALAAAARVLTATGERRALRDLDRIMTKRPRSPRPAEMPAGVRQIAWLEGLLADRGALLPTGIPESWFGQSVEVFGIPTGADSSVSFGIRWHGERPAVLWEQEGTAIGLTAPVAAPGWQTSEVKGEALWPAPSS